MSEEVTATTVSQYMMKIFRSETDPDFIKALRIYSESIEYNSQTNTNEIAYSLTKYKYQDSAFNVAGFYLNKQLIGYAQFLYLKEEQFIFVDYVAIAKEYRNTGAFPQLIDKLKELIDKLNYQARFMIGEINMPEKNSKQLSRARGLIKLLKVNNLGEIKCNYRQPMLGSKNFESNVMASLVIYPFDQHPTLKKETFIQVLDAIYFKHYERWYKQFLNDEEMREYSQHLHYLADVTKSSIKTVEILEVIGEEDAVQELSNGKVPLPTQPTKRIIFFLLCSIIFIALGMGAFFILKRNPAADWKVYGVVGGSLCVMYLITASMVSNKAAEVLNKSIQKFIDKIT